MKKKLIPVNAFLFFLILILFTSCESKQEQMEKIVFLRHSTGQRVWIGTTNRYVYKLTKKGDVQRYFSKYNRKNKTSYSIIDESFPAKMPNHPHDYYNIWVKHAGNEPWQNERTLEIITKEYDIIIWKHCYPVSNILEENGSPDVDSNVKTLSNYKLQYNALKEKMHEFPDNKFIVWTPAVHVKSKITEGEAQRTKEFHNWLLTEWDEKGDNIFLWDFYKYETEGGLYLADKYASSPNDSHPTKQFGGELSPLFAQYIIDVAQGKVE
jgi:hypothetical protein